MASTLIDLCLSALSPAEGERMGGAHGSLLSLVGIANGEVGSGGGGEVAGAGHAEPVAVLPGRELTGAERSGEYFADMSGNYLADWPAQYLAGDIENPLAALADTDQYGGGWLDRIAACLVGQPEQESPWATTRPPAAGGELAEAAQLGSPSQLSFFSRLIDAYLAADTFNKHTYDLEPGQQSRLRQVLGDWQAGPELASWKTLFNDLGSWADEPRATLPLERYLLMAHHHPAVARARPSVRAWFRQWRDSALRALQAGLDALKLIGVLEDIPRHRPRCLVAGIHEPVIAPRDLLHDRLRHTIEPGAPCPDRLIQLLRGEPALT